MASQLEPDLLQVTYVQVNLHGRQTNKMGSMVPNQFHHPITPVKSFTTLKWKNKNNHASGEIEAQAERIKQLTGRKNSKLPPSSTPAILCGVEEPPSHTQPMVDVDYLCSPITTVCQSGDRLANGRYLVALPTNCA